MTRLCKEFAMYRNGKRIFTTVLMVLSVAGISSRALGQSKRTVVVQQNFAEPADPARELFTVGQKLYDQYRYTEAERTFREVIQKYSKSTIADKADYYLIRTLVQSGKRAEALDRIHAFSKSYPKSGWLTDIEELRIGLTSEVTPAAMRLLVRQAPPVPPSPPNAVVQPSPFGVAAPPPPPVPFPFIGFGGPFGIDPGQGNIDPEVSLQQEILRAIFRSNADRAIEIATERLKANPADPVVVSTLNMVATSHSPQALAMLMAIAKSSPNAKARRDAIFWIGHTNGDKDSIVYILAGLLPAMTDEDSDAVAYTLNQIRTDKAFNTLTLIARDKNRSEKSRGSALYWIGQSRAPNRVSLLDDIYKNAADSSQIRRQALYALSQTRDPQAVTILSNIAASDPDIELRKQAVYWLGRINTPEASQALENMLRKK